MKKNIYSLIITLILLSGSVFAKPNNKKEATRKQTPMQQWEATTAGKSYKQWQASPAGKKVYAGEALIQKQIKDFTNMEGVITSLTLPPRARLGFGIMVKIKGTDYILAFGPEKTGKTFEIKKDFMLLHSLKVNDKITIRSHHVSHAPKYAYPIIAGDYIAKGGKVMYKRVIKKGAC
jgi:hypothetical protein